MKIDTTKFENYATMSAEEKVALLESYEYDDNADALAKAMAEATRAKQTGSTQASEIAKLKRLVEEKSTKEENDARARAEAEAERAERDKAKDERIAELERANNINVYAKRYRESGFSDDTATKMAEALAKGDMDSVFAIQKEYNDAQLKALAEAKLKSQSDPTPGMPPKVKTEEDMYADKLKAAMGL